MAVSASPPVPSPSSLTSIAALHKEERDSAVRVIQAVKRRWIGNPRQELNRFETDKPNIYNKLINRVMPLSDDYLCSLMHGVELMEALRDTHYCFFHGQSFEGYILTRLITEWVEMRDPSKAGKYRKFFRLPEQIAHQPKNVSDFFNFHGVPEYIGDDECLPDEAFNDHKYRLDLLSVSGSLITHDGKGESAVFYYTENTDNFFSYNYYGNRDFIRKISEEFGTRVANEIQKFPRKEGVGFLQVIAVPKELVEKREVCGVYNALAIGFPSNAPLDDLRRLQNLEEPIKTGRNEYRVTTQYRILTGTLDNERVLTVTLTDSTTYKHEFGYNRIKTIM